MWGAQMLDAVMVSSLSILKKLFYQYNITERMEL